MTRAVHNALAGMPPGLPSHVKHVPFGHDSRFAEVFGITDTQAHVVVALLAADALGLEPVSKRSIEELIEHRNLNCLGVLERRGWVEVKGRTPRKTEKLWGPTAKAWRTFFPEGWKVAA